MALTKSRSAITQLTATGQSTTLSVGSAYSATLYIRHVNGTGTITTQGVGIVEGRTNGGSTWFTLTSLYFGLTASGEVELKIPLDDDLNEVRIDYTAPVGSTGHTLDAEIGTVTSL